MKTHTFYLTEAQRNNLCNYLGIGISKLREERHSVNPLQSDQAYARWIADAEQIQAIFEFQGSGGTKTLEETTNE